MLLAWLGGPNDYVPLPMIGGGNTFEYFQNLPQPTILESHFLFKIPPLSDLNKKIATPLKFLQFCTFNQLPPEQILMILKCADNI